MGHDHKVNSRSANNLIVSYVHTQHIPGNITTYYSRSDNNSLINNTIINNLTVYYPRDNNLIFNKNQ